MPLCTPRKHTDLIKFPGIFFLEIFSERLKFLHSSRSSQKLFFGDGAAPVTELICHSVRWASTVIWLNFQEIFHEIFNGRLKFSKSFRSYWNFSLEMELPKLWSCNAALQIHPAAAKKISWKWSWRLQLQLNTVVGL